MASTGLRLNIKNLKKFSDSKYIEKILSSQNLAFKKIDKHPPMAFGVVMFESEEDLEKAEKVLQGFKQPNGEPLAVSQMPFCSSKHDKKNVSSDVTDFASVDIRDKTIPLWRIKYEEQLQTKQKNICHALKKVTRKARRGEYKSGYDLEVQPEWMSKGLNSSLFGSMFYRLSDEERAKMKADEAKMSAEELQARKDRDAEEERQRKETVIGDVQGAMCKVNRILAAPQQTGYRNKVELTVGFSTQDRMQAVAGFRVGGFESGNAVATIQDCTHVSLPMKRLTAKLNADFFANSSCKPWSNQGVKKTGVWREVMLRHSERHNQMMVLLRYADAFLEADQTVAQVQAEVERAKELLCGPGVLFEKMPVVSFYAQRYNGLSVPVIGKDPAPELLHGVSEVTETLGNLNFQISPQAFFQVNTMGAEVLFDEVKRIVAESKKEMQAEKLVILDLCCGTGVIGMALAGLADLVVGVEIVPSAVQDARLNAARNQVTNAAFVAAPCELVLSDMLQNNMRPEKRRKLDEQMISNKTIKAQEKQEAEQAKQKLQSALNQGARILAVVDPPRNGLHPDVIKALRMCPQIDQLVYIACDPTNAFVDQAILLCKSPNRKLPGNGFIPVEATPVDLFPHTNHIELVARFRRSDYEWPKKKSPEEIKEQRSKYARKKKDGPRPPKKRALERKKQRGPCYTYEKTGKCKWGLSCKFWHNPDLTCFPAEKAEGNSVSVTEPISSESSPADSAKAD